MSQSQFTRRTLLALSGGAFAASAVVARADAPDAQDRTIEGNVVYRERMMLPAGARVEVELVDVSLADAPATVIGRTEIRDATASPIPYRISYDPALIEPRHSYALQARILDGDTLMFINTTRHSVLGDGDEAGPVEIRVERVAAQPDDGAAADSPVGRWLAEDILGGGVIDNAQTTLEIAEDGRVSGRGGCNSYGSTASIEGEKLTLSPVVATQMACPEALMNQEQKYFDALGRVAAFRLVPAEQKLLLLDADGETLVRLAAM
ncbi:YbaY family lipoprotein [Neoaquamicrobium sediminum]|uniref:YbaY family lipoprotein n=1 Tax=Neoaquamicrobium sediminum TaxID=1849104 RepID=UPI00360FDDD0